MSQTYTSDPFSASYDWDDTLQSFEDNDKCFASSFSGTSAPASPEAGRLWMCTDSGDEGLRVRNSANTAWHKVLTGTADTKVWIYAAAAAEGWIIDSSVTDRVLALAGGSGAYSSPGTAGLAWTSLDTWFDAIDAHVHAGGSHVHQWYDYVDNTVTDDNSYNGSGVAQSIDTGSTTVKGQSARAFYAVGGDLGSISDDISAEVIGDMYTSAAGTGDVSASTTLTAPSDPRPAAAIGTLQYPDLG